MEQKHLAAEIMKEIFPDVIAEKQKLIGFKTRAGRFCALHLEPHGHEPIRLWTEPIDAEIKGMRKWHKPTPKNDNLNGELTILSESTEAHYYEFDNLNTLKRFCRFYNEYGSSIPEYEFEREERVQKGIEGDDTLSDTEKKTLIKARRGQGKFRENVLSIEKTCRLTDISDVNFLVASHIWPWRKCTTKKERLDGYNGLMLTPAADFLFDRGYMSFSDNGQLLFSRTLDLGILEALGLSNRQPEKIRPFSEEQRVYLKMHRELHSIADNQ